MDFKEILLILIGIIVLIWVVVSLNNFVSGTPILMYIGSPAIFGLFAIVFGGGFTYYVYENYAKHS